jgi:hypothetical protein
MPPRRSKNRWKARAPMYKRRTRFKRAPFSPPEPPILSGQFKDKRLSDLSDEELIYFLRVDARHQIKPCTPSVPGWFPPSCPDFSQYWFAKYELERRKPEAQRTSASVFEIANADTKEDIAWKLAAFGFRAASRRHHPDHGGDNTRMQRINEARDLVRARLKTK